jgi:hypothetical protein
MVVYLNGFASQNACIPVFRQDARVNPYASRTLFGYQQDMLLVRSQSDELLMRIRQFFDLGARNARSNDSSKMGFPITGFSRRINQQTKDPSWVLKGLGVAGFLGVAGLALWMHHAGSLPSKRASTSTSVGSHQPPLKSVAAPAQKVATQGELLNLFNIPYSFELHTVSGHQAALDGQAAATALKNAKLVAVGDLHASYYKLIETLLAANLIAMPPETAKALLALVQDEKGITGTVAERQALYAQVKALIPQMQWVGGNRQLLLIGDVLADRGPFDNITLDIIEYLTKDHPERLIRLASNHDHEALKHLGGAVGINPDQSGSMRWAYDIANANGTEKALEDSYILLRCVNI